MKKSTAATLIDLFIVIPLTLYVGTNLPGRSYYVTGTLIVIELLIPFLMAFEGRRPQARELVTIAVLCALAVAARAAVPLPHFKAIYAVIIIAGIAFGAETGFLVGAVSAFASNFFYGQGPYTPWQMLAYGIAGLAAGFMFRRNALPRKPLAMAVFGFLCVVLMVGPILDTSGVFLMLSGFSWKTVWAMYVSGFAVNVIQGGSTFVMLLLAGRPLLDKLDRLKLKYGILQTEDF